uniref:Sm domain-containing protein n=1 Tax=Trypanosoma congolense (strain IL3000) TaxID=1068625 RepID=G0UQQ4_TRYCI|nr:conserved hypothetical protein [Trypanosoma congolense IL3000]
MSAEARGSAEVALPLPVAVIQEFLERQKECIPPPDDRAGGDATAARGSAPEAPGNTAAPMPLRAEVETIHGYVYEGRLIAMDEHYNVTLVEATKRRQRACDVENALLSACGHPAPAASPFTRREFVGSVLVRSSNLLMIRFPHEDGGTDRALHSAFKVKGVKVRRQMNLERQKSRVERRERKHLPARTPPDAWKSNDGPRQGRVRKKKGN